MAKLAKVIQRDLARYYPVDRYYPSVRELIACGSEGLSYLRVCSLLRRFEVELAEAAGIKQVKYSKTRYDPSGAGPFGRLGGGRRGLYRSPHVLIVKL